MDEVAENSRDPSRDSFLFVPERSPNQGLSNDEPRKRLSGGLSTLEADCDSENVKRSRGSADANNPSNKPNLAPYHPSFNEAEQLVKEVCDDFLRAYKNSYLDRKLAHSAIDYVCKELDSYKIPAHKYPTVGAVACLGPAGVGKSSTINAILGQQSSALEHDGGDRGTFVVHVYAGQGKNQLRKYHVMIQFHSISNIQALARKHDANIKAFLQARGEEADNEDNEDDEDLKDKYDTAIEFFMNLLCENDDFEDNENLEDYFGETGNRFEETWNMVSEQLKQRGYDKSVTEREAADEAELLKIFKQFSRPASIKASQDRKRKFSPWPIVDKITIHQDLDILNAGVHLADTPGVNDSNLTVVENTDRCLKDAQAILVFASYKRSVKSTELDKNLRKCIALGKDRETYLVITCIDEKKSMGLLEADDLSDGDREKIARFQLDIKNLDSRIKEDRAAKDEATTVEDMKDLDRRVQAQHSQRQAKQDALKQLYVTINCKSLQTKLQAKLQVLSKNAEGTTKLKVFFVSNPQFQKHVQGTEDEEDRPFLDVEATGIPALSRHLYSIPAIGKFDVLRNICAKRVPSIFRSIDGILEKSTLERKKEVRAVVERQLRSNSGLHGLLIDMNKIVLGYFNQFITATINEHDVTWVQQGTKLVNTWASECKSTTFKAFCRRQGDYRLPIGHVEKQWNFLIRAISDDQLTHGFGQLLDAIDADSRAYSSRLKDRMQKLKDDVDNCDGSHGVPMDGFYGFVDRTADDLAATMQQHFDDVRKCVRMMRAHCVLDVESTYVARVMKPAYERCYTLPASTLDYSVGQCGSKKGRAKKPKTSPHDIRKEILKNCISGGVDGSKSLFIQIGELAYHEFNQFIENSINVLQENAVQCRSRIMEDFDIRFKDSDSPVKNEECPEAVAELKAAAERAREVLGGRMSKLLKDCDDFERLGN